MNPNLIFLGTGTSQGIPIIGCKCNVCRSSHLKDKRLRTSAYVEYMGLRLLIDAGPDFRQQLLRANINNVDAILLTHEHKDHTAGLDDVRAFNYINKKAMDIYAEERVQHAVKQEFSYAFEEHKYPGAPEFSLHTIDEHTFHIGPVCIKPIRVWHAHLPILGFRIADLAYITDASNLADSELPKLKNLSVLVLNAVRPKPHASHFSLQQAIDMAKKIGAQQTYLTHISHQMGLHDDVEKELPSGIMLAYDGLTIEPDTLPVVQGLP
ncbi:MAG: MBL fold metallo-hydrolase [Bacteroidetes bacterium]|nr:MBL fold metallo-hydrolase [Bacteroidota bacterium]